MGKQLSVIESSQIEWVPVDSLQKKTGNKWYNQKSSICFPLF